jgi:hypothetical protein
MGFITMDLLTSHWGAPVHISAPPASAVIPFGRAG